MSPKVHKIVIKPTGDGRWVLTVRGEGGEKLYSANRESLGLVLESLNGWLEGVVIV